MKILINTINGLGLGHLVRTINLANEIRKQKKRQFKEYSKPSLQSVIPLHSRNKRFLKYTVKSILIMITL